MWVKKMSKLFCGNDECGDNYYGGNKGVLPEEGKSPIIVPKKTFGEELYETTKKANEKIRREAIKEAKVLFSCVKDGLVEEANKGNSAYIIPLDEFKELMKKNNLHSDTFTLIDSMWDVLYPMDIYVNRKTINKEEVVAFQWYK